MPQSLNILLPVEYLSIAPFYIHLTFTWIQLAPFPRKEQKTKF